MTVQVVERRLLIEPPERGDCEDPGCATIVVTAGPFEGAELHAFVGALERHGRGVLLVAKYQPAAGVPSVWIRVCAACDERRLRAWLAE